MSDLLIDVASAKTGLEAFDLLSNAFKNKTDDDTKTIKRLKKQSGTSENTHKAKSLKDFIKVGEKSFKENKDVFKALMAISDHAKRGEEDIAMIAELSFAKKHLKKDDDLLKKTIKRHDIYFNGMSDKDLKFLSKKYELDQELKDYLKTMWSSPDFYSNNGYE